MKSLKSYRASHLVLAIFLSVLFWCLTPVCLLASAWSEQIVPVSGTRYSVWYSINDTGCFEIDPRHCGEVWVKVWRMRADEPEGERSGVAGSTRVELAPAFQVQCKTKACRQDDQTEWVRIALGKEQERIRKGSAVGR